MGEVHPRYGSELHLPVMGIVSCNQQVVTGDFSEAEHKCYLVNAGRAAANWKKVLRKDCKHKVMSKYEECSGDFGRSKELAPDPMGRVNE